MNAEELFESHYHIAKQTLYRMFPSPHAICKQHRIEMADLLQYARTGLWLGALSFDETKNTKFMSHAINNIKWHVSERLNRETDLIHYTINKQFDTSERYGIISIDEKHSKGSEGNNTYHDMIPSDLDIEADLMNIFSAEHMLSRLTEKQRKVIELKLKGVNIVEISRLLNTSREDVRTKLDRAKTRLEGLGYASNSIVRKKIDKSKGRKVSIEGKIYNRIMDACKELSISQSTVSGRLVSESEKFREWHYID